MKGIDKSLFSVRDENGKLNLFAISLPLFLQLISNNLLQMINTAILSNYDQNLITAMNASSTIINFLMTVCNFASVGMSIILSQALGRNDRHVIDNIGFNAVFLTGVVSAFVCLLAFFLRTPLLGIMHLEGQTLVWAEMYFGVQLLTGVFMFAITNCFASILRCYGKVTVVVLVNVGTSIFSAVNMSLFAFTSLGSFMDMIYNAMLNNFVVMAIKLLCIFLAFKFQKLPFSKKISKKMLGRIARIGIPAEISSVSYALSTTITTSIISSLDPLYINIKVYCTTIFNFICFFGMSIGQSGGVLIGRVVGGGDNAKAKKMHRLYLYAIVAINVTLAVIVFFLREPLFSIFDRNPDHLAIILPIFALDILVEAGRGVNHCCQNSLNAVGDVTYSTVVSMISCWVCAVLLSYLFAIVFGLGLIGCWMAFICDEWLRAILYEIRWKSGKWECKKI